VIVVDASVLASSLLDDGADGDRARRRLEAEELLCAPEVVDLEVANAWRRDLLAGRVAEDRLRRAIVDLASMRLLRASHRPLMRRVWELRHNLSAYDAAYVALAEALDATLLTADGRSTRAPSLRCEVELLQ
jgi:predicted nucleic acid-binding protein